MATNDEWLAEQAMRDKEWNDQKRRGGLRQVLRWLRSHWGYAVAAVVLILFLTTDTSERKAERELCANQTKSILEKAAC